MSILLRDHTHCGNELLRSRLSKLPDNFNVRLCLGFGGLTRPATDIAGELIRRNDLDFVDGGCNRRFLFFIKHVGNSGNISVSCSDKSEPSSLSSELFSNIVGCCCCCRFESRMAITPSKSISFKLRSIIVKFLLLRKISAIIMAPELIKILNYLSKIKIPSSPNELYDKSRPINDRHCDFIAFCDIKLGDNDLDGSNRLNIDVDGADNG
ncbi:hypothetical protein DERP_002732 [Dermatophagoides pteronyssinus]|uniref:Uncharacterized protein n=1 Tax=Dermatophagoides pteronyssinus TaxID=6956 RepID=A0ABQ8JW36_DERPT|nr:hypothetical protein DERP_002732 [Dermatophagoides pteronyssinus]